MPFVRGARRYASEWVFPGGTLDNRAYYGEQVHFATEIDEPSQLLLFDAQTSGGLLLAVPADKVDDFMSQASVSSQPAWLVGEVFAGAGIEVLK